MASVGDSLSERRRAVRLQCYPGLSVVISSTALRFEEPRNESGQSYAFYKQVAVVRCPGMSNLWIGTDILDKRSAAACSRAYQPQFVSTALHMFDIATAIADLPRGGAALISTLRCAPRRRCSAGEAWGRPNIERLAEVLKP
jgi:hypothetical protein